MINQVLLSVIRDAWLIDPIEAREYFGLVQNQLSGVIEVERATEEELKAFFPSLVHIDANAHLNTLQVDKWGDYLDDARSSQNELVAILPIGGAMTKANQACGPRGTSWMAHQINQMQKVPQIKGIVLSVDSPGGQVSGTRSLADAIKNSSKPIVTFADDGIIASAAYWAASASNRIISSHQTNRFGSIGVYMQLIDMQGYYEKQGAKVHTIYSSHSSEKNSDYLQALGGNYKPLQKDYLDQIAASFIDAVKANRKEQLNLSAGDPFKGAMFFSDQAMEIGLVDEIGSMSTAVATVLDMAKNKPSTHILPSSTNNDQAMKIDAKNTALLSLLGLSVQDGEASVEWLPSAEEAESLNSRLQELLDGEANAETAQDELTTAQDQLNQMTTERDNWKLKAEEYGKASGKFPKATGKEDDPITEGNQEDPFFSEADEELAQLQADLGIETKD